MRTPRARIARLESLAAEHHARNYQASPEGQRELAEFLSQAWYSTTAMQVDSRGIIRPVGWAGGGLAGVRHAKFVARIVQCRGDVARAAESFQKLEVAR